MSYSILITLAGLSAMAAAQSSGSSVAITEMAFGDGGGVPVIPEISQTALINEVYRKQINGISQDHNLFTVECVIPVDQGGFWVREVALFMSNGEMFATASYPEVYKPTLLESAGRELYVKMILAIANTSVIDLSVNSSVIFVTQDQLQSYHPIDEVVSHKDAVIARTNKKITGVAYSNGSVSTIIRDEFRKLIRVETTEIDGNTVALSETIGRVDGLISTYGRA